MINSGRIKNIYIRESNWLGDAVMTIPSLEAIRSHFKNARITIGAKGTISSLLSAGRYADDFFVIPHPVTKGNFLKKWQPVFTKRKNQYDFGILFTNSFESALELYLMGIPIRAGYATDGRGLLLTESVEAGDSTIKLHEVEYFANLVEKLGIPVTNKSVILKLGDEDVRFAEDFFNKNGLKGKLVTVLHPGTSTIHRAWHPDRFASVCTNLIREHRAKIVIVGAPEDNNTAAEIASMVKGDVINAAGKYSIRQSSALIGRSSFFLGNDSGPMHIAASLGVPVVIIFGPGNTEKTKPYTSERLYIQVKKEFPCRPCRQRFFKECKPSSSGKPECIESITVDDVLEACDKIINNLNLKPNC